jgi:nucleoside-diphosphate-sugar epimerase
VQIALAFEQSWRELFMRILVTGATGFVGTHLCQYLANKEYAIRATFRSAPVPVLHSRIEWIQLSEINGCTDWTDILEGIDYIVHLAGVAHRVGVSDEELRPLFDSVNRDGTRVLAEAVARSSAHRMVFVSSVKVLSADGVEQPDSAYGWSKLEAERAVAESLVGDADWCVLRPCLVYGPGNTGNMARLIRLSKAGLPLPFASIENRKSFLYVGNLVSAIERCLVEDRASRRKFVVSDGESLSTPDLLRLLGSCSSRRVRLFPVPVRMLKAMAKAGDAAKRITGRSVGIDSYSVDRLCSTIAFPPTEIGLSIGWQPPFSTAEGLMLTLSSGGQNE